jgi:hypothetical protein
MKKKWLPGSPVLVINFGSVFYCDFAHFVFILVVNEILRSASVSIGVIAGNRLRRNTNGLGHGHKLTRTDLRPELKPVENLKIKN